MLKNSLSVTSSVVLFILFFVFSGCSIPNVPNSQFRHATVTLRTGQILHCNRLTSPDTYVRDCYENIGIARLFPSEIQSIQYH